MKKKIIISLIIIFCVVVSYFCINNTKEIKEYNSNKFNGAKYYQYYSGDLIGSSNLYESLSCGEIVNSLRINSSGEVIRESNMFGLNSESEVIKKLTEEELYKLNILIEACEDKNMTSNFNGANGGVSWVNRNGKKIVLYNSMPSISHYIDDNYNYISEFRNNGKNAKKLMKYISEIIYDSRLN